MLVVTELKRMRQRYDTAANFTSGNPTLLAGEIGIESDTRYVKVGDGSTAWNSLPYVNKVPDASADGEALAYDQANWRLGTGIVTGAVRIDAADGYVSFRDAAGTPKFYFRHNDVDNEFYLIDYDNTSNIFLYDSDDEILNLTGNASVQVPPITGANQAAQVTAYNATTGQLQIGGHEVGFTGWRKLTTINGWTGNIYIARNGNLVHMLGFNLDGGSATSQNVVQLSPTVGFVPPHLVTFTGTYDVYSASATTTPDVFRGMVNSVDVKLPQTDDCQFTATWITKNNWPSSLPGTAA